MATTARSTWKGTLKFSLITIPIRVFPATDSGSDVSFRQLHRKCHTPIQLKKWCPHCDEEVAADAIVKGYEASKGRFVLVEEEDIKKLRPQATHIVDLTHTYKNAAIDPVYIERVYYVAPDAKAGAAPFSVLREALADRAAVGHVAIHGREYLVAVVARDAALVMYTLRTAGEVRAVSAIEDAVEHVKVKPAELALARRVLDSLEPVSDLSAFTDHYQDALREMLAAKGEPAAAVAEGRGKAPVNLMEALRQSLANVSATKKRPARASARKPARVIAHPSARKARRAS